MRQISYLVNIFNTVKDKKQSKLASYKSYILFKFTVSFRHGVNEVVNCFKKLQMANEPNEVNHSKYEHYPVQDDHDLCRILV